MSTQPKTITRITWKNGTRTNVIRRGKWWHWTDERNSTCASSHLGNVIWQAEQAGATIERVPNPNYKLPKKAIYWTRDGLVLNF